MKNILLIGSKEHNVILSKSTGAEKHNIFLSSNEFEVDKIILENEIHIIIFDPIIENENFSKDDKTTVRIGSIGKKLLERVPTIDLWYYTQVSYTTLSNGGYFPEEYDIWISYFFKSEKLQFPIF